MFRHEKRNNYESFEDFEADPVGRQMLKMHWLWEDGEYPKKAGESASTFPSVLEAENPATDTGALFRKQLPPFSLADTENRPAFAFETPAASAVQKASDSPDTGLRDWQKYMQKQIQELEQRKPRPDAWQRHQTRSAKPVLPVAPADSPVSENAALAKAVQPVPTSQTAEAVIAPQTPYADLAETASPISQRVVADLSDAVRNKNPIQTSPYPDLVDTAGAIRAGIAGIYGQHHETATAAINRSNTGDFEETMSDASPDAMKGIDNSLRDLLLTVDAVRYLGSRLFDPQDRYLDPRPLKERIDSDSRHLENSRVPEVADFMQLDWRREPDRVIELGGQYFRQSLLGTHIFGHATDLIKGAGGPVLGQIVGTVTGIARIYARSDDLIASALRGAAGSSVDAWDFLVGELAKQLPLLPRQALRFTNSIVNREMKTWMFNAMIEGMGPEPAFKGARTK